MLSTLLPAALLAAGAGPAREAGHDYRIDVRVQPVVDQYCELRVLAARRDPLPEGDPRAGAVAAIRALDRTLGPLFLGWGLVEGGLTDCHDADDLLTAFGSLPETFVLRDGSVIELREPALAIARELAALEPRVVVLVEEAARGGHHLVEHRADRAAAARVARRVR